MLQIGGSILDTPILNQFGTSSVENFSKGIINFLTSAELQRSLLPFKIIFSALTILFLSAFVYLLLKTSFIKWKWYDAIMNFLFPYNKKSQQVLKLWQEIQAGIESESLAQRKFALLEAYAMVEKYCGGFDDLSGDDFTNVEKLKETVDFAKRVLQDTEMPLTIKQGKDILEVFERALKDLQII